MNFSFIKAKKSLGQNFLIDHDALETIAYATEVENKNIFEVWPWYGALTEYLIAQNPKNLSLIELDSDMIKILSKRAENEWKDFSNLEIIHKNILEFSPDKNPYSVIANIPYYITSPILFHFLYAENFFPPEEMVILMQKEVGEKILANPKKNHFSYLSLAMYQACEKIEPICLVPKNAFEPAPKVDSIVLRFTIKKNRNISEEKKLLNFWDKCFAQPRKTLIANLKNLYNKEDIEKILWEFYYHPMTRAEEIDINHWGEIFSRLVSE